MNHDADSRLQERVHDFIVDAAAGELDEGRWTEFEQLLRENDEACRLYIEYMEGTVLLSTALPMIDAEAFDPEQSSWTVPPLVEFRDPALDGHAPGWPVAYLVATVVVGLSLLLGSFTYVSTPLPVADDRSPVGESEIAKQGQAPSVCRIIAMSRCKLAPTSCKVLPGTRLSVGEKCILTSGLMEIVYDTGAIVVLQGPATYEVTSRAEGYLSEGRLTARVEKKEEASIGHGSVASKDDPPSSNPQSLIPNPSPSPTRDPLFTVKTPTAVVADLGTEFGVEVGHSGDTVAHVYEGLVNVVEPSTQTSQLLTANEAVKVSNRTIRSYDSRTASRRFFRGVIPTETFRRLTDDFDDDVLDSTKWRILHPAALSHVIEANHRIELTSRGYLVTRRQYNPDRLGGLRITGRWTFADLGKAGEMMQIAIRSDGLTEWEANEVRSGLEFCLRPKDFEDTGVVNADIVARGADFAVDNVSGASTLAVASGSTFAFEIIDDGARGLVFNVTDVADPANAVKMTARLTRCVTRQNYIVFHNREQLDNVSYLDDVTIEQLRPKPEDRGQSAENR